MAEWIVELVAKLGYLGVFLLALLEHIFPPIPSELVMPLAGYHAAQGRFGLWGAVAAGAAGSACGTCAWYWIGWRIGERRLREWADRRGKWLTLDSTDVENSARWFQRHGIWAVFIGRLVPGLRTWISLPAGFSRMPLGRFLIPTICGAALWTTALTVAGYRLGQNYSDIEGVLGGFSWAVIAGIAILYVARLLRRTRPDGVPDA